MRLIGYVDTEKQAFIFHAFLLQNGIHSTYEPFLDAATKKEEVRIWVYEEDSVDAAIDYLAEFKENPDDPKFAEISFPITPPPPPENIAKPAEKVPSWKLKPRSYPLTYFIVGLCIFIFGLIGYQEYVLYTKNGLASKLGLTPLQEKLMFDVTASQQAVDQLLADSNLGPEANEKNLPAAFKEKLAAAQAIPSWKGVMNPTPQQGNPPLFEKIREGEVWRLFTPCLMHGGILHILFNMSWAWILIKMMETRLPIWKNLLIFIIIGSVANVAQYLMTGPNFLGFSGIIVGQVGFIWVRQKKAPWEGYPLPRSTIIFVLVFVLAMLGLEMVSFLMTVFGGSKPFFQVANTAHIVGGITGIFLGTLPFFSRRVK